MNKHAVAVAVAALAAFTLPALAQDKTCDLKFSSWVPPAHALHVAVKEWGDSLSKATKGSVKVTLYPSQQLGKAHDHYDRARAAIPEVPYIARGEEAGRPPVGQGGTLPFLMTNADGGSMG